MVLPQEHGQGQCPESRCVVLTIGRQNFSTVTFGVFLECVYTICRVEEVEKIEEIVKIFALFQDTQLLCLQNHRAQSHAVPVVLACGGRHCDGVHWYGLVVLDHLGLQSIARSALQNHRDPLGRFGSEPPRGQRSEPPGGPPRFEARGARLEGPERRHFKASKVTKRSASKDEFAALQALVQGSSGAIGVEDLHHAWT